MQTDTWGWHERAVAIGIIIGIVIVLAILITADPVGAAPLGGNRGGCAEENKWYMLPCVITDTGVGWVSGTCTAGYWFGHVPTRRTFTLDQPVHVKGCEGPGSEIYSAPGWPVRISK